MGADDSDSHTEDPGVNNNLFDPEVTDDEWTLSIRTMVKPIQEATNVHHCERSPASTRPRPPPLRSIEPNRPSLDEIDEILRDIHTTLSEWTASWGPVSGWWLQMKSSGPLGETAWSREVVDYIDYNRGKLLALQRLAAIDFRSVDHEALQGAWKEALNLTKEMQYQVAVADSLLLFCEN
jgi:hypothetical protein